MPKTQFKTKASSLGGMTLIELLTVIFLGSLLLSMVFLLYNNSSRSYIRQEAVMEQILNLRGGLSGISRQVRMAGNGFALLGRNQNQVIHLYTKDEEGKAVSWFKYPGAAQYGAKPIYGVDGGESGTDSITVFSLAPDFATPLGTLAAPVTASSVYITLDNVLVIPTELNKAEVLKAGNYLALVPPTGEPILVEAQSDATNLSRIDIKKMPSPLPNSISAIPEGSQVFNVKSVSLRTFRIDATENYLLMDSNEVTGDLMAESIEDLEVAYCLGADDPSDLTKYVYDLDGQDLLARPVKAVRLVLVSRSPTPDPYKGQFSGIPALNHTVVAGNDGRPRRFFENTVQLRNY
jgi:type II secretory pathway pseudopilin PulG